MQLTIELTPILENFIRTKAESRGWDLEYTVHQVLFRAMLDATDSDMKLVDEPKEYEPCKP